MDQQYDEFGNYIGPELARSDESSEEEYELEDEDEQQSSPPSPRSGPLEDRMVDLAAAAAAAQRVVPHEDKQIYPQAEEIYGDAEVLVHEEDTQPITQPIIAPPRINDFDLLERQMPETTFSFDFMQAMMKMPSLIRHVCVAGHLHHGKTSLVDMLVAQTHTFNKPIGKVIDDVGNVRPAPVAGPDRATLRSRKQEACTRELRYTDNRADEQERGVSIKACPVSLVLPESRGKSYLINVFDTPGHINFIDEVVAAMRMSDGVILSVDALEGPMLGTRKIIEAALREELDMVLVVNCIDRLILELRLPPADAFHKLRFIIREVNNCVAKTADTMGKPPPPPFNPQKGNVAFASARYNILFTLESFAAIYKHQKILTAPPDMFKPDFSHKTFAQFLWGDIWFNSKTRKFQRTKPEQTIEEDDDDDNGPHRSFVQFILIPLYKLIAHVVAEEKPTLQPTLQELGIELEPSAYFMDTRTLLRHVCLEFFKDCSALVDVIVKHVKSPEENAERKVKMFYTGKQNSKVAEGMKRCDPEARLMIHTCKNYHRPDGTSFDLFGRVMSGSITRGEMVKVLGEAYSLDDDEDMIVREASHLWIHQGRYLIEVPSVSAGNWILIGGVDPSVRKTSTITSLKTHRMDTEEDDEEEVEIFRKLRFPTSSVIRVACEPLNPSELPKMLEGLRKIDKSYPLLETRVEDSGEHVIMGTGELYLDCVLHDLRKLYGDLEIKSADPVVTICETVIDTSAIRAFADTPNQKNRIAMIAEPLEPEVVNDIENGIINPTMTAKELAKHLKEKHDWDALAARSVWAYGTDQNTNMLINDVLPTSGSGIAERKQVDSVKDFIVHGFQWATREGPLIEEQVKNVKVRLLSVSLASEPIHRNGGQIIPISRRVAYSALLLATPRLMEPMLFAEIVCPADCVPAILKVLEKRRGHLAKDLANPGTPLETLYAYIPAIDSFGFETDIRTHTSGQAFVLTTFDRWEILPGNPLDTSIVLRPLEPSPVPHLAREFLLKTRRRKGLSADVSIQKFFDEAMLMEMAKKKTELG